MGVRRVLAPKNLRFAMVAQYIGIFVKYLIKNDKIKSRGESAV